MTPQPRRTLTAAFLRSISTPGKYHDCQGTGLYLRVDPGGAKFWVQRITCQGRRREFGLGSFPTVSLAEAREAALDTKRAIRAGRDPLQEKRASQTVPSFAEATQTVYDIHRPSWRSAKHAAQFLTTLETYAFPRIGKTPVDAITTADVLAVLEPVWLAKPETARRVRQRIGTVMKWAVAQGLRADNPAETVGQALPRQPERPAHRKALPYP